MEESFMNVQDMFQYQNMGLPEDIRRMKEFGDFEGAIRLIDLRIADPDTPEVMRHCLTVHREMIKRLPEEFPYPKAEAIAQIRENIPDFTEAEFDEFLFNRRIRWIYVNGEMRIFLRFYSTLLKTEPDFAKRANAVFRRQTAHREQNAAFMGKTEILQMDFSLFLENAKAVGRQSTTICDFPRQQILHGLTQKNCRGFPVSIIFHKYIGMHAIGTAMGRHAMR